MTRLLTTLSLMLAVLIGSTGVSYALPPCTGDQKQYWHNCVGTETYTSGNKYVGEWKNGMRHGQGTYTFASGMKEEGVWKDDFFQYERKTPTTEPKVIAKPKVIIKPKPKPPVEPPVTAVVTPTLSPQLSIQTTGTRIALVVGNAKYNVRPLSNPARDARLIGNTLRQYGFRKSREF